MTDFAIETIEQKIGYVFQDKSLLRLAFTHASFANENSCKSNERLEFLGDSILNYVVAEALFLSEKEKDEGYLTQRRAQLVSAGPLSALSNHLFLDIHLRVGVGEGKSSGKARLNMNADLIEAIIAAIYLDGGMDEAKAFVFRMLPIILASEKDMKDSVHDYKSELQEFLQEKKLGSPKYLLVSQTGSSHAPTFTICVEIDGVEFGAADGKSKKEAQQGAAKLALLALRKKY